MVSYSICIRIVETIDWIDVETMEKQLNRNFRAPETNTLIQRTSDSNYANDTCENRAACKGERISSKLLHFARRLLFPFKKQGCTQNVRPSV